MLHTKYRQGQEQHIHLLAQKVPAQVCQEKDVFSEQSFPKAESQASRSDQEPGPNLHPPL